MTDGPGAERAVHEAYDQRLQAAAAAARRLREAIAAGDADAARAATTPEGWGRGRDSVSGLVRQALRKGFSLDPIGEQPTLFGGRGAAWTALSHPEADKPLGDLFVLLVEEAGGWQVAGVTKIRAHVGLYLQGRLPAFVDVEALPESERAADWAAPALAVLRGESDRPLPQNWVTETPAPDATVELLGTVALEAVDRAAVGFTFKTEDRPWGWDSWTILDTATVPSKVVGARGGKSLEALLTGLTVPWPKEDPAAIGVALTAAERPTDDAGASAILAGIVRKKLDEAGVDLTANTAEAARARALLTYALETGRVAPRPTGGSPAPPPAVPPALQGALVQALQAFLDTGVEAPGGLRVNQEAVEQQGGALMAQLFGDMARETVPAQLEVRVPVESPEPGGPEAVTLRLDRDRLLEGLTTGEE